MTRPFFRARPGFAPVALGVGAFLLGTLTTAAAAATTAPATPPPATSPAVPPAKTSAAVLPPPAPGTVEGVLACLRANIPESLQIREFTLAHTDRAGGSRTLLGELTAKREDGLLRASLKLSAPTDVSGSAYLVRENTKADEMYVYLPSMNKVRRINGSGASGSLFGTDISYQDFKLTQQAYSGAAQALEGVVTIDGRKAKVVRITPAAGKSPYSRVRVWVDDATCVALKTEFEANGQVIKRLSAPASGVKRSGKYWYTETSTLENLATGTRTVLKIGGLREDEAVPSNALLPNGFYH